MPSLSKSKKLLELGLEILNTDGYVLIESTGYRHNSEIVFSKIREDVYMTRPYNEGYLPVVETWDVAFFEELTYLPEDITIRKFDSIIEIEQYLKDKRLIESTVQELVEDNVKNTAFDWSAPKVVVDRFINRLIVNVTSSNGINISSIS